MRKKIMLEGMSCDHCVKRVREALTEINGIDVEDINLSAQSVVINTKGPVDDVEIKTAIEDSGYDVMNITEA